MSKLTGRLGAEVSWTEEQRYSSPSRQPTPQAREDALPKGLIDGDAVFREAVPGSSRFCKLFQDPISWDYALTAKRIYDAEGRPGPFR
jgi:hypothetical protein